MALVTAGLYGAGALLLGLSLLLPEWPAENPGWLGLLAGLAAGAAAVALVLARARVVVPLGGFAVSALAGTVIVSALVVLGGPATSGVHGIFYVFVTAFSFYYFPLPLALSEIAVAAIGYAVALAWLGLPGWPAQWLLTVGAEIVAGALIGRLGRRMRRLLVHEQAVARRLHELDTVKTTYLRALSHDLRKPLANVAGALQSLAEHRDALSTGQAEQLLDLARRNTDNLDQLLTDLLDIERIEHDALEPAPAPVDLAELVAGVLAQSDFGEHPLSSALESVVVPGDRIMLERIVDNVVGNAVRHTPPDTPIEVSVRRVEDGAQLCVEDAGPGVPQTVATAFNRSFEPASDLDSATLIRQAGIGLSLVAQLTRLHHGRARIEPRPEGGTRVRVELSAQPAPAG